MNVRATHLYLIVKVEVVHVIHSNLIIRTARVRGGQSPSIVKIQGIAVWLSESTTKSSEVQAKQAQSVCKVEVVRVV
jgi:hypothetical protein